MKLNLPQCELGLRPSGALPHGRLSSQHIGVFNYMWRYETAHLPKYWGKAIWLCQPAKIPGTTGRIYSSRKNRAHGNALSRL